ncbi:hypothetical protein [Pseudomonas putida]|uniref:hypothetical protein n=1 Tax=Pseudomonas putida TaxID=303 RepID=UPI002B247A7F|nr:hypothetical protein [Pseudomonas putida]
MDVRSALTSNNALAVKSALSKALFDERRQAALEAIKDAIVLQEDPSSISDETFDQVAEFIVTEKLFHRLPRIRRSMRRQKLDRRFIDFYSFCISEMRKTVKLPALSTVDQRGTAISIAMRLKSGGDATEQEVAFALSTNPPSFVRDWIYRAAAGAKPEHLPRVIQHVKTLIDLESLLHELSIAGPLHGKIHTVSSTLASKITDILLNAPFRACEIRESGFEKAVGHPCTLPKITVGTKLMRSDVEAFNSRFVFETADGYLAFGTLGIGLGQYAVLYDGIRQVLLSLEGMTPSPAHIPGFLRLDQAALKQLSKSETVLLNPNFPRLGDCLDRFSFITELVERSKVPSSGLSKFNILDSVNDNFILPQTHNASRGGLTVYSISDLRSKRFDRHYINSCYFRNNVDRRLSFSKTMVRSLSSRDQFDSQAMILRGLRSHGYFIVHFAIEAEKRAFNNQWDVLAQIIVLLRKSGIDKIVMLNSGLTSVAAATNPAVTEFETNWPEKIIGLLPSEYRNNAFAPVDLHMRSVDRKAQAIATADFFIGGLVTATLIPTSAEVPSLVIGSKTSLSDEYRWPSGEWTFFVPSFASTDVLSEQAKSVPANLHAQYMSYEINSDILYSRLTESLTVAIIRWRKLVK